MEFWMNLVIFLHVLVAVAIIGLVLLQHGKGADMGSGFGGGSSGSLFGATGSANFLSRTTAVLAAVFFMSSLGLTYLGSMHGPVKDVMQQGVMGNVPKSEAPAPGQSPVPAPAPVPGSTPAPTNEAPKPGAVPK